MSSGMKKMIINTQERAISPDINRLQDFKAKDVAEIWRYLADVTENLDLTPGVITEYSTVGAPLRAEIVNGVMVEPAVGTLNIEVTPGLLFAISPDGGTDDSNYKYAATAGTTSLSMTANPGVSPRIDVIECQITEAIVETDNRDIFNPSTGLFTAAAVTKARQGELTFRVRTGTVGAGYPGHASGWLPLAIASVPAATTTNDTIIFWDVRPLLSDRVRGLSAGEHEIPVWGDMDFRVQNGAGTTPSVLEGYCRVGYKGRWLGGRLRRGTQGTDDTDSVDLRDVRTQEGSGITYAANTPYYVYLMTPLGLPRWSRYTDASAGFRRPRAPNGMLVVSLVPCDARSRPQSTINLPNGIGFVGGASAEGVCISSSFMFSTGLGGFYTQNRKTLLTNVAATITNAVSPSQSLFFRAYALAQTHFPQNATSIFVKGRMILQSPNTPTAYTEYLGINPTMFIREQAVANPGTGFSSPSFVSAYGWSLKVPADDVYFTAVSTGVDQWLPIGGAVWPLLNVHPVIGYDLQMGSYGEQVAPAPANPITLSAVVYVNGWEF